MAWRVGAVLAMALCGAQPATAETTQFEIVVQSADLDLDDPTDAQTMASRLDEGARRACGGSPRFYPEYRHARAWSVQAFETCRTAALGQALAALGAPRVTAAVRGATAGRGSD